MFEATSDPTVSATARPTKTPPVTRFLLIRLSSRVCAMSGPQPDLQIPPATSLPEAANGLECTGFESIVKGKAATVDFLVTADSTKVPRKSIDPVKDDHGAALGAVGEKAVRDHRRGRRVETRGIGRLGHRVRAGTVLDPEKDALSGSGRAHERRDLRADLWIVQEPEGDHERERGEGQGGQPNAAAERRPERRSLLVIPAGRSDAGARSRGENVLRLH